MLKRTSAGGTCINHVVMHFAQGNLPFGGVNNSGIGSAHGEFGFKAFSHERAVVRTRFNIATLLYPPYPGMPKRILNLMVKPQYTSRMQKRPPAFGPFCLAVAAR